jgi:hypothetical protein
MLDIKNAKQTQSLHLLNKQAGPKSFWRKGIDNSKAYPI